MAGVEEVMEEGHDEDGADAVAGSHDAVDQSVTFLNRSVGQDGRRVVDKARTDSKHEHPKEDQFGNQQMFLLLSFIIDSY